MSLVAEVGAANFGNIRMAYGRRRGGVGRGGSAVGELFS